MLAPFSIENRVKNPIQILIDFSIDFPSVWEPIWDAFASLLAPKMEPKCFQNGVLKGVQEPSRSQISQDPPKKAQDSPQEAPKIPPSSAKTPPSLRNCYDFQVLRAGFRVALARLAPALRAQ